jgi:lipid A 4'-phosphatase
MEHVVDTPDAEACMIDVARVARGAVVVGTVFIVVFALLPFLDLTIAHKLFLGDRFAGQANVVASAARNIFIALYVAGCAVALAGLVLARARAWLGLRRVQWLFLALCLSVGPGLVANVILKDNWGRARPKQLIEFGGTQRYTPPLQPALNCHRNCSFVSGEASSIFALFFALAILIRRHARVLLGSGLALGLLAGLIRMVQGAHFLSDILFAGVVMALTVATLYFAFEARASGGAYRLRLSIMAALAR